MPTQIAGSLAPDFEATTWEGQKLRLSEYRGKKVWLAFFRYAACPLCNLRVHDIIQRHASLQAAGLQVLAVFQSPPSSVRKYVGKQAPPFPLICDPSEALYATYGLRASLAAFLHPGNLPLAAKAMAAGFLPGGVDGTKTRIPGDFLIDEEGTLRHIYYGEKIGDHIPFSDVEAFLGGRAG